MPGPVCGAILVLLAALFPAHSLAPSEKVRAWEGSITLPTYPWIDSVLPEFAELGGRIVYPYSMQDDIAKQATPRTYKALFLENEYLEVTCLPELGGRIHSVLDKTRGVEMFHQNDEIKPALIALRGAWISGGIEWNTGPQGHTVTAVSPVDALVIENEDGSATLVVGNTEKIFRTRWTVRLTLRPGRAFLDEEIRIFNPTDGIQPYYFWNCTAFPCRPGTRFVFPMTLGTDHSGTTFFSWPRHEGKDLTWLRNYPRMTSIFAYECEFDFFGAYDVDRDQGLVGTANHHELRGKKAWTWGQDDFGIVSQMSLSDAGPELAPYIEIQSGPLRTQAEYGMLRPRQEVRWREWWYPVHGLRSGFEYATRDVAIQTERSAPGEVRVGVYATGDFPDALVRLVRGESVLVEERRHLSPRDPQWLAAESVEGAPLRVEVRSSGGALLADFETPLPVPEVEVPDLARSPARADGRPTVDEIWHEAHQLDRQSKTSLAREKYLEALEEDPMHGPSLRALAVLDLESGLYDDAAARLARALERNPDDGEAWYYLGAVRLRQGRPEEARRAGYRAVFTRDVVAPGYDLVGRAEMMLGRYTEAVDAFARALAHDPFDSRARDHRWLALHAAGRGSQAIEQIERTVDREDPTDVVPRALLALSREGGLAELVKDVDDVIGEREFTLTEAALTFAEVGLLREAARILNEVILSSEAPSSALGYYYSAWFAHRLGDAAQAEARLRSAAALSPDLVFPSRPEALPMLEFAVDHDPGDAHAFLHLGNLLAGLHRIDEALPRWRRAVELDPTLAVAFRNLALHAWRSDQDEALAEDLYRRAVAARPGDQSLHYELVQVLESRGKRVEAIELVEPLTHEQHVRADVLLWLAQAYVDERRYDDAIDLLTVARFSNWEGRTRPHDIFMRANLERGKVRLAEGAFEDALRDFSTALTWPENLEVGWHVGAEEAEAHYLRGQALQALGRPEEARSAWREGAGAEPGSEDQNRYRDLCSAALQSTR